MRGWLTGISGAGMRHFTGIDSPEEVPENPEIHIDTGHMPAENAADVVLEYLWRRGIITR